MGGKRQFTNGVIYKDEGRIKETSKGWVGKHLGTSDIGELLLSPVPKEQKEGVSSEYRESDRRGSLLLKVGAFGADTTRPRPPSWEGARERETPTALPSIPGISCWCLPLSESSWKPETGSLLMESTQLSLLGGAGWSMGLEEPRKTPGTET